MKTSNYVLIEALDYANKHYLTYNKQDVKLLSRMLTSKAKLKKLFGSYKNNIGK